MCASKAKPTQLSRFFCSVIHGERRVTVGVEAIDVEHAKELAHRLALPHLRRGHCSISAMALYDLGTQDSALDL